MSGEPFEVPPVLAAPWHWRGRRLAGAVAAHLAVIMATAAVATYLWNVTTGHLRIPAASGHGHDTRALADTAAASRAAARGP